MCVPSVAEAQLSATGTPSAANATGLARDILDGSLVVFDDFNRADTSPGTLGTPPLGAPWDLRGAYVSSFPLPAATSGQIQNGAFVDATPYTVYAVQNPSSTVTTIGARLSWVPSTGLANSTGFAMLIGENGNLISDMVHFVVTRSGWDLQVRGTGSTGGSFVTIASQAFSAVWPDDGTPLTVDLSISGQTVTVDVNGKITTASDPRVPSLIGPYAVWEHYYGVQGSPNLDALKIGEVWAGDDPPAGSSERNMPDTARSLPKAAELLSDAYGSFMWNYLDDMVPAGPGGVFLSGQGIDGDVKIPGAASAKTDGYLITAGFDYPLSNDLRVGISYAYGSVNTDLAQTVSRTDTSANEVLLYGRLGRRSFIDGFVGGAIQSMHSERSAVLGGTTYAMTGNTSGVSPLAGVELGTVLDIAGARFEPAAGVQYTRPGVNGYTEAGNIPAMRFAAFRSNELNARIGFDADWSFRAGGFVVKPDARGFFVANVVDSNNTLTGAFVAVPDEPVAFTVAKTSPEWLEFGLGADVELWDGASLGAHYSGTCGRGDLGYKTWTATLQFSF